MQYPYMLVGRNMKPVAYYKEYYEGRCSHKHERKLYYECFVQCLALTCDHVCV